MFLLNSEFDSNYEKWCFSEWMREINNLYPILTMLGETQVVDTMKTYNPNEKELIALGLIKRSHVQYFSEKSPISVEEQYLIEDFLNAVWNKRQHDIATGDIRSDYGKIDKKMLLETIKKHVFPILGDNIQKLGGSEYVISTPIDSGELSTTIDFGGRSFFLRYGHQISTNDNVIIAHNISVHTWLCIGQSCWSYLSECDEIKTAENFAFLCKYFLEAIPSLFNNK